MCIQTDTRTKKLIFIVISYKTGIHVKEMVNLNVIYMYCLTAYETSFTSWIITVCVYKVTVSMRL